MLLSVLERIIVEHVPPLRKTPKGWMSGNCPLCIHRGHSADTRGRFGIKVDGNSLGINCFNCDFKIHWEPGQLIGKDFSWFLRTIGISELQVKQLAFQAFREKEGVVEHPDKVAFDITSKWKTIKLPKHSQSLTKWAEQKCTDKNFLKVAKYAIQRCITNFDNVYWTPNTERMINRRLIIPYYHHRKLVGYTARFAGTPPDKTIPRYDAKTPVDYIYNMDNFYYNHTNRIVLVNEGVIDALLTKGLGVLGAINTVQIELINKLRDLDKRIIVVPDRDHKGEILVKAAIANGWECSFPPWEKDIKDAGMAAERYGRILTVESIIEYAVKGSTSIRLKRKMDHFDD